MINYNKNKQLKLMIKILLWLNLINLKQSVLSKNTFLISKNLKFKLFHLFY